MFDSLFSQNHLKIYFPQILCRWTFEYLFGAFNINFPFS